MRLGWMGERVREREKNVLCHHNQLEMMRFLIFFWLAGWLAQTHTHTQAHWSVSHFGSTPLIEQCNSYSKLTFSILLSPSLFLSRDSVPSLAHSTICLCRAMNIVGQWMQLLCLKLQQTCLFFTSGWMKMVCVFVYTVTMIGPVGCLWPWF